MLKFLTAFAAGSLVLAAPAHAALAVGAKAPLFTTQAAVGGKSFSFTLQSALKKGPVVLYFFPAAHTAGCNIEAHMFADAIDRFKAQGATVIGITAGNTDQLQAFSTETEHCAGKFTVAADAYSAIAHQYDAVINLMGRTMDNRTSYVITPDDNILYSYTDLKPQQHIDLTLDAVTKWRAAHPG